MRDFDVAKHQPHPPGYPVLIAAAKIVAGTAHALGGLGSMVPASWTAVPVETAALSLLAMIAGACLIVAIQPLARAVSGDAETAIAAGVLAIACPLALVTVSRPLSDAPGLAAALGVQALLATAFAQQRGWRTRDVAPAELAATGRLIVLAAFAAGLAIGLRTQTAWLTLPLLILVIADRAGRAAAAAIVGSAVTFTVGVLCWAVPLVIASGGPAAYWRAIASQAGEDLEGVDMLFTSTRPLWRLAMNLLQTFVLPWGPLPLAVVVLTLAAIGIVVLLRRDRRGLVLLAGAAAPYAIFHLVWQENVTTRYALPIVPPIALLAGDRAGAALASGTLGQRRARPVDGASRGDRDRGDRARDRPAGADGLYPRAGAGVPAVRRHAACRPSRGRRRGDAPARLTRTRGACGAGWGRRAFRGGCWTRPPAMSGSSWCATGARAAPGGPGWSPTCAAPTSR